MKKTTIKRTAIITSALAACALIAVLCFTGCGNNNSKTETTAASTTVAATTAASTTAAATGNQNVADDQNSGSNTQSNTAADNQQKAATKACEAAASLYGEGNWGVASIETKTSDAGTEMYYIGVINYANAQSPTYYFYVDGDNCSPDNSATEQASDSDNQEESANKMKAVQSAVELAENLYGEGSWVVSSCEQQTASNGSTVYYIGVTNYADSQGETHYFYADGTACNVAE